MAGLKIHLAPLAAFLGAGAAIVGAGALSMNAPYVNGDQLVQNLKTQWPVYLGLPLAIGVAGYVGKSLGNPGLSLGKLSVKLW